MIHRSKTFDKKELTGVGIVGDVFIGCRFQDVELKMSNFEKCKFMECDFAGVIIKDSGFVECDFEKSRLSNIDFSTGYFSKCSYQGVVAKNSVFKQVKRSDQKAVWFELGKASFVGADLGESVFVKCRLVESDFSKADLSKCVFERCNLEKANLSGVKMEGVVFEDTRLGKTVLDIDGFLAYGQSKGFVLSDEE